MFSFISSITASLVANIISAVYSVERKTRAKKAFDKRTRIFHSEISPYVLGQVLPSKLPSVSKKLARVKTPDKIVIAPYISLSDGKELSISKFLATEVHEPTHNIKLINWLTDDLGKKIDNDSTFTIQSIRSSGEVNVGISDYYSTISTCDKNYFDLIRYFPIKGKKGSFFAYKNNRNVLRWLASLEKIVENKSFSHYHASIGCSVLTVMKSSDGTYKYPIKINSQEKSSGASDRHVLPSFMFQPISSQLQEQERELDLETSVLREYGEELLGLTELESAETADVMFNHINKNKYLKRMRKQLENGEATLEVTGLVLDVFRLRPEVTFLLILSDDVYSRNIVLNWETEKKSLEQYSLDDDEAYFGLISDYQKPLCAPGLAALVNGRNRAIEKLKA